MYAATVISIITITLKFNGLLGMYCITIVWCVNDLFHFTPVLCSALLTSCVCVLHHAIDLTSHNAIPLSSFPCHFSRSSSDTAVPSNLPNPEYPQLNNHMVLAGSNRSNSSNHLNPDDRQMSAVLAAKLNEGRGISVSVFVSIPLGLTFFQIISCPLSFLRPLPALVVFS